LPSRFVNPVDVFRSARQRACQERAFVLTAVGIENEMELDGDAYVVRVDAVAHAHALHHLAQYDAERRSAPPPEPEMAQQPQAWLGSLIYALVLLIVPLANAQDWWPTDPYAAGVMDPAQMHAGQWWRAWTALTLHWDASHLLGNLGAGILLGYSAAQIWGNARAWLLIVTAAAAANLVEAGFNGAGYVSAGASTAVFAALGLVAAWSWRTRRRHAHNWLRRLAPLVAGIAVLAMMGGGGGEPAGVGMPGEPGLIGLRADDHTNVLSHALGFATGALTGVAVAALRGGQMLRAMPAWAAAAAALGQALLAWFIAIKMA
jgi:rhomboid protease GluP